MHWRGQPSCLSCGWVANWSELQIRSDQIDVSPHSPTCEITWGSGIFGQGINRDAVRPGMTSDIATRGSRWVGRVG